MEPNQGNKSPHIEWSDLPDLILGNIYSFLGRKDQVNLSLVCHKWKKGYESPSVWKTFTFKLTMSHLSMANCPVLKYAVKKYSKFFKHVKISYDVLDCDYFQVVWRNRFLELLEILAKSSELISIEFEGLAYLYGLAYCNICRAIGNFLESQHKLQRVEFFNCDFSIPKGVKLLRQLIEKNSESLKHLRLRGFVLSTMNNVQNTTVEQNLPTLSELPSLTTLDTDYSFIFVSMVTQAVENGKTPALSKIILEYNNSMLQDMYGIQRSAHFRGLKSTDWQFLKRKSPNLQVDLILKTFSLLNETLEFFILPDMPITLLKYEHLNTTTKMETGKLFDHLLACKINDHLEYLHLSKSIQIQDLVTPFRSFLPKCTKLKSLEMEICYSIKVIDLMEYLVRERPKYLEKVILHIYNILNDEHYRMIRSLTSKYVSELKLVGMNVVVDIDYKARESGSQILHTTSK